ncbi:uncharacterized protein LOC116350584 [Contarinia nasturtii]|uniref:uncharacterized protein LOC116350584 n=1 Tax=Contarinia nasturtii TaxID=265458 RepID=UPI0012D392BD|nr:uncharacterized protein LOC116350584 [Contarinia nasturtii]
MKSILVVFVSAVIIGHSSGHYLPSESCGCSGSKLYVSEYADESQPQLERTDTKYKFDFSIEEPKKSESNPELKSYSYNIASQSRDSKPVETKYKFDYTIQAPANEQRTSELKDERTAHHKHECQCQQGKPCSCGYSPEQCAMHCSSSSSPSSRNLYSSGYVLPVRYDNDGDYVVYELPQDGSEQQYAQRIRRQATADTVSGMTKSITGMIENIKSAIQSRSSDSNLQGDLKDRFTQFKTRLQSRSNNDDGESSVGSSLGSIGAEKFDSLKKTLKDGAGKVAQIFKEVTSKVNTRRRRQIASTTSTSSSSGTTTSTTLGKVPVLRVKEYESGRGKSDEYLKYSTQSRVELPSSDKRKWDTKETEKATHCHQCGSSVTESVCKQCGSHQPQYIEYVQGKAVSYYPGAVRSESGEKPTNERRYIYDRYGHKYLENNGNLRLITPQQYDEAIVRDQPNFPGLADILNSKKDVIREMNPVPGRVMAQPDQLAIDAMALIRDMSYRSAANNNNNDQNKPEKRSTDQNKWQRQYEQKTDSRDTNRASTTTSAARKPKNERSPPPRSMYQVVPMQYEGKDGKLVVQVYSSKSDRTNPVYQKYNDERRASESTTPAKSTNTDDSKPTVRKFTKNNKDYEILSFEDYKNTSNEDVRHILEHLHGKQSW